MEEEFVKCDSCHFEMKEVGETGKSVMWSEKGSDGNTYQGVKSQKLYQCLACKYVKIA